MCNSTNIEYYEERHKFSNQREESVISPIGAQTKKNTEHVTEKGMVRGCETGENYADNYLLT